VKYEGSCHRSAIAFEVEGEFDAGLDYNIVAIDLETLRITKVAGGSF
jgi:hypothetical protein